jgi:MoxR-like ATPase
LADEINRAPAKVQSALLEAMQEKQVTIGDTTFRFCLVLAQNPIEQEEPTAPEQGRSFMLKTVMKYLKWMKSACSSKRRKL